MGKLFLFIVDKEDAKPKSTTTFLVNCSFCRLKANQVPAIKLSCFPLELSIRVEKGIEDDLVTYFLQSMHHDKSSLITEFPLLGGHSCLGSLDGD